jgi:hypothetical protein
MELYPRPSRGALPCTATTLPFTGRIYEYKAVQFVCIYKVHFSLHLSRLARFFTRPEITTISEK